MVNSYYSFWKMMVILISEIYHNNEIMGVKSFVWMAGGIIQSLKYEKKSKECTPNI